jgi:protein MpaA
MSAPNSIFSIFLALVLASCAGPIAVEKEKTADTPKAKEQMAPVFEAVKLSETEKPRAEVEAYCKKIDQKFNLYRWGDSGCRQWRWKGEKKSIKGDPIVWLSFGDSKASDVTLIMCGVHGDELTPVKFCYDVMEYALGAQNRGELGDKHVIVAPLVNPDSFLTSRPSRTNARGVDVNRNFPTQDFQQEAVRQWRNRYGKNSRRFPGLEAMSEPEVVFQVQLIREFAPKKIISVHAPLSMLDYDGPVDEHTGGKVGARANELLIQMSGRARGYRIKNYPFFPGSLGNWAGNERNIPTYTLELPSSDPALSKKFWERFRSAIAQAISKDLEADKDVAFKPLKDELEEVRN